MRLLFCDFDIPERLSDRDVTGGWSVQLGAWLRALEDAGHETGVLTRLGARKLVGEQDGPTLLETYDPKRGIKVVKYLYWYLPSMLSAARAFRPDAIVQACSGLETGMLAWVARRLDVPFVHRVANDIDADDRYRAYLSPVQQVAYRYGLWRSAAIVCQNDYQRRALEARYPGTAVGVIHNPFELPAALPRPLPRASRRYIAWLAVFRKAKDVPLLVKIARTYPDVLFKVGGSASLNYDAETAASIDALRALPNVEMVGYVRRKDVSGFLGHASALLSTSIYEGFSNTFLESFAAGTPVLARRAVDPDHIISRNGLGLIADDADGLTATIGQLLSMGDEDYSRLTHHCQDYVVANHSGQKQVRELMAILDPILAKAA
jgi:glycosyltransferase involved in cell wall biosynthesis